MQGGGKVESKSSSNGEDMIRSMLLAQDIVGLGEQIGCHRRHSGKLWEGL